MSPKEGGMLHRWRCAWAWTIGAVLFIGCSVITKPCEPPCAPGETCVAGVCIAPPPPKPCVLPERGPVCTALTPAPLCFETASAGADRCQWICADGQRTEAISCSDPRVISPICQEGEFCHCWHRPPGSPWLKAECPSGQECSAEKECITPAPVCPSQCPEGQECIDPAKGCLPKPDAPPLIPDEELTAQDPQDGKRLTWDATNAAIHRWRAKHPEKWIVLGDSQCLADGVAGIDAAFLAIATELKADGIVAGQSIKKSGKRSDCIFVNRIPTKLYEETHAFEYGRACVATVSNAVKGVYVRGATAPAPDKCPFEPCPLKVFADTGKPHWKFNAKPHTMGNCDSTPVEIKNCAYCTAIDMGDGGTRCECPVRPDGHPEREAVEAWLTGGTVRDSRNGQDCRPNHTDNPMAFLCGTGNCRNCNADKTVCTAWF